MLLVFDFNYPSKIMNLDIRAYFDCFCTTGNNWNIDVMVYRTNDTSYVKQMNVVGQSRSSANGQTSLKHSFA